MWPADLHLGRSWRSVMKFFFFFKTRVKWTSGTDSSKKNGPGKDRTNDPLTVRQEQRPPHVRSFTLSKLASNHKSFLASTKMTGAAMDSLRPFPNQMWCMTA